MSKLIEGANLARTIYLLIAGLIGIGIWIGSLTATVHGQTKAQEKQEEKLDEVHEQTTRIDERQEAIRQQLKEIKRLLEMLRRDVRT